MPGVTTKQKTCSVEDCMAVYVNGGGRGFCPMHYARWYKHGDPYKTERGRNDTLEDRLRLRGWDETDAGCWEFRGSRNPQNYGSMHFRMKTQGAHRWAYEAWVGPIPEGHVVRHKCDNPPCINPDHLETGTHADNARDASERRRGKHQKLTPADRDDIRQVYASGDVTQAELATRYGVSAATISDAIHRKVRPVSWVRWVRNFRRCFGVPSPATLDIDTARGGLAVSLVEEEVAELRTAYDARDIVEVADALADVVYTAIGCAEDFGIDLNMVLRDVHRSNMSKLDADGRPIYREDGKVLKGPNYSAPNIKEVLGLD